jgi:iron complex outermembrane receptor protein
MGTAAPDFNGTGVTGALNASTTLSYRSDSQQFELRTPGLDQSR